MNTITPVLEKLLLIGTLIVSSVAFAADWNTNNKGVVLDGYDVVAYQALDQPVKGLPSYAARYDGVKCYFVSKENQQLFIENPTRYTPKYNGYCAFAVGANNAKVPANPETFKFYNGELLLFFNDLWEGNQFNTKVPWNQDESKLFNQAEANWPKLN